MKPSVDMALFLTAVLKGAHATRQRHLNQAAIQQRWQLDNPRRWQLKHLRGLCASTWPSTHRTAATTTG